MSGMMLPNLPKCTIKSAIIGDYPEIIAALEKLNIKPVVLPENKALAPAVRRHADMSVLHLCEKRFLCADNSFADKLSVLGAECELPDCALSSEYPNDTRLNCLILGDNIICGKGCDHAVKRFAQISGKKIITVRQGYVRCSCAVVDERSVITADSGIASALRAVGVDVLLIRPGHISLPGYDYGFIGGCCGKLSANAILFSGSLNTHPDGEAMRCFITSRGVEIIEASDGGLLDFGGFIPL